MGFQLPTSTGFLAGFLNHQQYIFKPGPFSSQPFHGSHDAIPEGNSCFEWFWMDNINLVGVNSNIFLKFSSLFGEMIQFDEHIFRIGWNHQLV